MAAQKGKLLALGEQMIGAGLAVETVEGGLVLEEIQMATAVPTMWR